MLRCACKALCTYIKCTLLCITTYHQFAQKICHRSKSLAIHEKGWALYVCKRSCPVSLVFRFMRFSLIPYFPLCPTSVIISLIICLNARTRSPFPSVTPAHLFLTVSRQLCVFSYIFAPVHCQIAFVPALVLDQASPAVPPSLSVLFRTGPFLRSAPCRPVPPPCPCSSSLGPVAPLQSLPAICPATTALRRSIACYRTLPV